MTAPVTARPHHDRHDIPLSRPSAARRLPRILLVISTGLTEAQVRTIQAAVPDAEYLTATDDTVMDNAVNLDALIGCPRRAFTEELLVRAGQTLRWVHASGAGVDEFLIPRFVNSDILFTSGKIIQGPGVADHAMALLLALARRLHLILRDKSQTDLPRPIELRGKTAVIVGVGGVGLLVAERAGAFGMTVLGVNAETLPLTRIVERIYPPDQLNDVLPSADAVIVCTPLTHATQRMFGTEQFRRMKRSAFFINVSRGKTVDTDALVQALRKQQILGAGLDVTDPEPLPDDHPLREVPNLIITPHIAGISDHNRQRSFELIKTNIARFVDGLPLLNVVNKDLGY